MVNGVDLKCYVTDRRRSARVLFFFFINGFHLDTKLEVMNTSRTLVNRGSSVSCEHFRNHKILTLLNFHCSLTNMLKVQMTHTFIVANFQLLFELHQLYVIIGIDRSGRCNQGRHLALRTH